MSSRLSSAFSSSSAALTRQSSARCLQVRFSSNVSLSRHARDSISQSGVLSHPIRSQIKDRSQSSLVSSTCQCRQIATMVTRPFSNSKSAKAQAAQQQRLSLDAATTTTAPPLPLTNLPYFIRRTPSNQLPVYLSTKSGGTRQETKVRKTEGDLETLRAHLQRALNLDDKPSDVTVNHINGHITVKGFRKPEVLKFLEERRF